MTSAQPADISSPKSSAFAEGPATLEASQLSKGTRLCSVDLQVRDGETLVVVGPSGAGKTSLLRVLAGLERPDSGTVRVRGRDLAMGAANRRIALVFSDDTLFPHLTLYENLAFPLRAKRVQRSIVQTRVQAIARHLEIAAHLNDRPARLSGGQRARAALGRALLSDPLVLLLDEPLAHIDPQLRARVQRYFSNIHEAFSGAAIHVTHDHTQAFALGGRVAIMMHGRIVQIGEPREVYDFPANIEIARFLGSPPMNLLNDDMYIIGIRPEHLSFSPDAALRGRVLAHECNGPDTYVRLQTEREEIVVRTAFGDTCVPPPGEEAGISLDPRFIRRFDRTTGRLLRD
ncbi:MAG TPA: ABC transporter ATP-binding protein [Candidatus Baltobacteraceae bacterium]|nr:ABC transporter ATP-binding protein [Candidatus Baltobacteraceae bacterium]